MTGILQNHTSNFLTSTDITDNLCKERRRQFLEISHVGKVVAMSLLSMFAVFGIILNLFLIILLRVTNQLENRSFRLIFYATVAEMSMNVSSLCKTILIAFPDVLPCTYLTAERMFSLFTMYAARYITCLIAVDRYMRVKHLQDYHIKFTSFWYRVMLGSYLTAVFSVSACHLLSSMYNQPQWIPRLVTPLNIIVLIIFLVLYTKSYIKLRQHVEQSRNISTINQDLTKITKFYLIFYLISNLLVICTSFVSSLIKSRKEKLMKQDTTIVFLLTNTLNNIFTGIVTSISTLIFNRATKAKLSIYINTIRCHLRPNQQNEVPNHVLEDHV